MLPSFFKTQRHKRFEYQYRHYDPDKERHEELKRKYSGEERDFSADRMRADLRSKWEQNKRAQRTALPGTRLLIIIAFLALLSYLILS
jgi:hypothetical protein